VPASGTDGSGPRSEPIDTATCGEVVVKGVERPDPRHRADGVIDATFAAFVSDNGLSRR
jgi:hypothetical protein